MMALKAFAQNRTIWVAMGRVLLPGCTRFQQGGDINLQQPRRFAESGGCARVNIVRFRPNFAVASIAKASYSWQTLTIASHAMCGHRRRTKLLSPGFLTI
jgi:hypothetical protein